MRQHTSADQQHEANVTSPAWPRVYGSAMYTLAGLWLAFTISQCGMAGATDQPWWVYQLPVCGPLFAFWHAFLGYHAYCRQTWARWGALVTITLDFGPIFIAIVYSALNRPQ